MKKLRLVAKIFLAVFSALAFSGMIFWSSIYYIESCMYLYHSQETVIAAGIFFSGAIIGTILFIMTAIGLFKGKKIIKILCSIILVFLIPLSVFTGFIALLVSAVGADGCSYTEDVANYGIYDMEYDIGFFPQTVTEDMNVVKFSYFYKYADTHQSDIYLEVKFDNEEVMNKYLGEAKKALCEEGMIAYKNPYASEYIDLVPKESIPHFEIDFDGDTLKYVEMYYKSVTYSYDELTIIYNCTDIGNDIFIGDNPDKGYYYPKYLGRFGVEWGTDNNYVYSTLEKVPVS